MDPLSILSVVAAAVQFVDFGQRLFSETWHIYRSASGQSLVLENLSAVSTDITQLSTTVKETLAAQKNGASAAEDADRELLRLCAECDAIATKVLTVLPNASSAFQSQLAQDKQAFDRATFLEYERRFVGECFRAAPKGWWQRRDIEEITERLNKVRQDVMMVATNIKHWEQHFSDKLDTMIGMLSQTLESAGRSGPEQRRSQNQKTVEKTAADSMHRNSVTNQVTKRIWSTNWEPDASLLASFPQHTDLSVEGLNSVICESLRFDSMDNREEAITKTFYRTFQWVFGRVPQISPEGLSMWSSLPDWLEGNSGLPYWITGKPGSGKSTMMKFILNHPALDHHLQIWSQGSALYKIKYYAWKPGFEMGTSADGLLRTLLHQMLVINPNLTPQLCPRRCSWELEESFSRLLAYSQDKFHLVLFIDGLDEFDLAPVELCRKIQSISSHSTVKVCVASRPWPQFSDAFVSSPGLQMHLLTDTDIQVFVRGHFQGVVAFQELNNMYQGGGDRLLTDIVKKAKGVFLWTALVTKTLIENLVDGSSLRHLQETLDTMPSEIESLYDAIFAAISPRLLPGYETRGGLTMPRIQALDMNQVQASLKRRLGARTRGILELVPQTRTVEYLHRTAAEWISQPHVWKRLRSVSSKGFDAHFCLFQAETIQAEDASHAKQCSLPTLHYASHVDPKIISDAALTAMADRFNDASTNTFASYIQLDAAPGLSWTSYKSMGVRSDLRPNTFDGLAAQFAILPYIRCKFKEKPLRFHPVPPKRSIPLLEQAIFGPQRYSGPGSLSKISQPNMPMLPYSRRLEVVGFLLERGNMSSSDRDERDNWTGNFNRYLNDVMQLLVHYRAISGERRSYVKRLLGLG
ncbi:hypothetical protein BGZ61DRAFT_508129 [Ilyonectria robusta]|uniref:uncharacterized protein n=1 Tax=Ilyonectria robusta TaxID=1079257 RepID=UPI001E8E300F|nr:uncharacterized protein BGZ61DRAFT_508129 [Ilyonectria robusta]KAH8679198.1 hypothetical protein BGZ61DRAFT_508129 [Ilyonectria robusta]